MTNPEKCKHHRGSPIFHEGSKGGPVANAGCSTSTTFCRSNHAPRQVRPPLCRRTKAAGRRRADGEESVDCRWDHYETPNDVRLTVYAKAVDAANSSIEFKEDAVVFSLLLPRPLARHAVVGSERCSSPSLPSARRILVQHHKFKVDLVLTKQLKGTELALPRERRSCHWLRTHFWSRQGQVMHFLAFHPLIRSHRIVSTVIIPFRRQLARERLDRL